MYYKTLKIIWFIKRCVVIFEVKQLRRRKMMLADNQRANLSKFFLQTNQEHLIEAYVHEVFDLVVYLYLQA